jgi:hypothetical protein
MPICDCELHSQSEHEPNPGPVGDPEVLIRLIYTPEHVNEDGTLKNSAIPKQDLERLDLQKPAPRGFSLIRSGHISQEEIDQRARDKHESDPVARAEVWAYNVITQELRELLGPDGQRGLCIVDQALQGDPSHAAAWDSNARKRGALSAVRDELIKRLNAAKGYRLI